MAVSGGELSLGLPEDADTLEAARIVGKLLAVVAPNRQEIAVAIDADDADVFAGCDTDRAAPLTVTDDVARLVSSGPPPVGARQLLARREYGLAILRR